MSVQYSCLHPRFFLLGNTSGAALSKPLCTSTDEQYDCVLSIVTGDAVRKAMIRMARSMMAGSLVFVAVHQGKVTNFLCIVFGNVVHEMVPSSIFTLKIALFYVGDEILVVLPGTIIRSDGVVATCASRLSFRTIKELQVTIGYQTPIFLFLFVFQFYK